MAAGFAALAWLPVKRKIDSVTSKILCNNIIGLMPLYLGFISFTLHMPIRTHAFQINNKPGNVKRYAIFAMDAKKSCQKDAFRSLTVWNAVYFLMVFSLD